MSGMKNRVSILEKRERKYLSLYLSMADWLFCLTVGPMIYSFYCALCDWDGMSAPVFKGV